ncbi:MAG: hypothetical protein VKK04_25160 [Synechococcales bacterium]|nr:hypothetical protein [Synechococcales bacterium]
MNKNASKSSSLISVQTVVFAAIFWGVVSLLVFLLGSPITPRPQWYGVITYFLENVAMLAAAILCFRNWRSPQIVSGRIVWLLFGLGISSYFVGNILLGWWELVWGLTPDVSPADLFFLLNYLLLGIGMLMAVVSKRLNLTFLQWLIVAGIAVIGTLLAYFISYAGGEESTATAATPPVSGVHTPVVALVSVPPQRALPLATTPPTAPGGAPTSPEALPSAPPVPSEASPDSTAASSKAPQWVVALDKSLVPLAAIVSLLYVVGDIFLLVMATMLLLAFWGGRFSQSWRFIAAAAFSFYIADIWFAYAIEQIENYETGALPEVFWIFSGVLFSIGAAMEYSLSTRSRRGARRRS